MSPRDRQGRREKELAGREGWEDRKGEREVRERAESWLPVSSLVALPSSGDSPSPVSVPQAKRAGAEAPRQAGLMVER